MKLVICIIVLIGVANLGVAELRVTGFSPTDGVDNMSDVTITVTFNQPMVPLQQVPETEGSGPVLITPEIKGKYRWLGTQTLVFRPTERLPFATEFIARIPKGTSSLSGEKLAEDVIWRFETPRPRLERHFPRHNEPYVRLDVHVWLLFNIPMNPDRAKPFIQILEENRASIKFDIRHPYKEEMETADWQFRNRDPEKILVLAPRSALNLGRQYSVNLNQGLLAAEGKLGLEESRSFAFRTYNRFQYEGVSDQIPANRDVNFKFSNPVTMSEFVKHIKFDDDLRIEEHYKEAGWSSDRLWISLPLEPNRTYAFTIDAELTDIFGNRLGQEVRDRFRTIDFDPYFRMPTGHNLIEGYGPRVFPIFTRNVDSIELSMKSLSQRELIDLLKRDDLFWSWETIVTDFDISENIRPDIPRNEQGVTQIEIDRVLKGAKSGVVIIKALDPTRRDKRPVRSIVQLTEIGLTAKISPEKMAVWVTHLKDASPVAGSKITVRSITGRVLWEGETGEDGVAMMPGWKQLGIKPDEKPIYSNIRLFMFAEKDGQSAYLDTNWGTGISPWRFKVNYQWNPQPRNYSGLIFSDRGIYRKGETVKLKGMVREKTMEGLSIPDLADVELTVLDSMGEEVVRRKVNLSEFGSFDSSLDISDTANLGPYQVQLGIPGRDEVPPVVLATGSFRVAAFRKPEFEVAVRTDRSDYVDGDDLKLTVEGKYLFGAPMKGNDVSWTLRLNRTGYYPKGWKGYFFGPMDWAPGGVPGTTSRVLTTGSGKLDADGLFRDQAKLTGCEIAPYSADIEATVRGESRQNISGRESVLVHPGDYYVGVKPSATFTEENNPLTFQVISVTKDGDFAGAQKLKITVFRRYWNSVRRELPDGRYRWVSEKVDEKIGEEEIVTGESPVTYEFTPKRAGLYFIEFGGRDESERQIRTDVMFYVTGKDYVAWERTDDAFLKIVRDKDDYAPGDTAKLMIQSPYERAQALVTVEREGVINHWVINVETTAPSIEIPIEESYMPNVFISVVLIRGRIGEPELDSDRDLGKPEFKIGYVELPVDPQEKRLTVKVATEKDTYKPGEEATVSILVSDAEGNPAVGEVTLAVVDRGILNQIGYSLPDPFDTFYARRPLAVSTAECRRYVVEMTTLAAAKRKGGGGGMGVMLGELRTNFVPTAYWNPSIITDVNGVAEVSFKLPDTLTSYLVMVVVQTKDDTFGKGESRFVVNKPLSITPALPRFARVNDRFEAGGVVHNYTRSKLDVIISAEAEGITLQGETVKRISLEPGDAKEVRFNYWATRLGEATFTLAAKAGDEQDAVQLKIPVIAPVKRETVAHFASTVDRVTEAINIPDKIHSGMGGIEFRAASTAMVDLAGPMDYLFSYPYGCLEQRLSRVLPMIIAEDLVETFDLPTLKGADYKEVVRQTLKDIARYHLPNGGFSFWPGSPYDSPYVSTYAMYALAEARKAGYEIDESLIDSSIEYLRRELHRSEEERYKYPYEYEEWLCFDSFVLYVLALWDRPELADINRLFEVRDAIPIYGKSYLARAAQLVGRDDIVDTLIADLRNSVRVDPTTAHFEEMKSGWLFHSDVRTTAIVLLTILETRGEDPLAPKIVRWLLRERKNGRWRTTQENFFVLDALNNYLNRYEKEEPDFTLSIKLAGQEIMSETFKGRELRVAHAKTDLDSWVKGENLPLEIEKTGAGRAYYEIRMTYYPINPQPARDEGFQVVKTIELLDGRFPAGGRFPIGTTVKITLKIINPQGRNYVVVDDPLPAGFEAIDTSLQTESQEMARKLGEIRRNAQSPEERWRWWGTFNHVETGDDSVRLFADYLMSGVHTYVYLARTITPGKFAMPSTVAECMYEPEIFGWNSAGEIEISSE